MIKDMVNLSCDKQHPRVYLIPCGAQSQSANLPGFISQALSNKSEQQLFWMQQFSQKKNLAKPFSEESWKITLTLVETTNRVAWHPRFTKNCNLATEYFPNAKGL